MYKTKGIIYVKMSRVCQILLKYYSVLYVYKCYSNMLSNKYTEGKINKYTLN